MDRNAQGIDDIEITEWLLVAGFFGFVLLMSVAYVRPDAMSRVRLGDTSPTGLAIMLGGLLSITGLLAFFHGLPETWASRKRNLFRFIYAAGFGIAAYCSAGDWHCFVS